MKVYFINYPNRIGIVTKQNDEKFFVLYTEGYGIQSGWFGANEIEQTKRNQTRWTL